MKNNIPNAFWGYTRTLPAYIQKQGTRFSHYVPPESAGRMKGNVSPAVIRAIEASMAIEPGGGGIGCIAEDEKYRYAEFVSKSTVIVAYEKETGEVFAGELMHGRMKDVSISSAAHTGKAVLMALMPVFLDDPEFSAYYSTYRDERESDPKDSNAILQEAAQILSSNVYYRVKAEDTKEHFIPLIIPETGNLPAFDEEMRNEVRLTRVYSGTPIHLGVAEDAKLPDTTEAKEKKEVRSEKLELKLFPGKELSDYEKSLIPTLPSYYIETEELKQVVKIIDRTTLDAEPMRNFMFRGPSGTGKSVGAQYVAKMLNRPFVSVTCSANTEMVDLLSSFVPNTSEDLPDITFGDIQFDPEGAWEKLTGEIREEVDPEEVFAYLLSHRDTGKDFRLIESDFVKAIREGWVVEIQEADAVTQPAVLMGLNKILNMAEMKTNGLLLADGSRLVRHPDSVVIFTTNVDYEGCRAMNQSVLDRMNLIYDMELPDDETLFRRTQEKTGYGKKGSEEKSLRKMIEVIRLISDFLANMGIVGTCGPRALSDWVRSTQITGDVYKSGIMAVVNKAASDQDDREAIISSCLAVKFLP